MSASAFTAVMWRCRGKLPGYSGALVFRRRGGTEEKLSLTSRLTYMQVDRIVILILICGVDGHSNYARNRS